MATVFNCPCGKSFSKAYLLRRHQNAKRLCSYITQLKLNNSTLGDSICDICNKKQCDKYKLKRHKIICAKKHNTPSQSVPSPVVPSQASDQSASQVAPNQVTTQCLDEFRNILTDSKTEALDKVNKMIEKINALQDLIKNSNTLPNDQSIFDSIMDVQNMINNNTNNNTNDNTSTNDHGPNNNINGDHNSTTNNTNDNSVTNNTTNNNDHSVTNNDNSVTNNTTNNITNNNITIIYPFGYENIMFLSEKEMMKILLSNDILIKALDSIYSRGENQNYHKNNDKSDHMLMYDLGYKLRAMKDNEFVLEIIENTIQALKRMFYICKNNLSMENQLAIWENIKYIHNTNKNDMKNKYKHMNNKSKTLINKIFNLIIEEKKNCSYVVSNNTTKKIHNFDEFKIKFDTDAKYKDNVLKLFEVVLNELKQYKDSLNDVTVTDDYLRAFWTDPEDDIELDNEENDVTKVKVEDTPRYKYHKKMTKVENKELAKKKQSLGDINAVCNIREERSKDEIELLTDEFDLSDLQTRILRNKLIIEPMGDTIVKIAKLNKQFV